MFLRKYFALSGLLCAVYFPVHAGANPDLDILEQRVQALESASRASNQRTNIFNPAISLILQGGYARYGRSPDDYSISGFALSPEVELAPEGLGLAESELVMSANVDDLFAGRLILALTPEGGAAVEEAFVETISLPAGLSLRTGRFYSEIGYLNTQHPHAWNFADAPLVYRAMMGGSNYADDGVQMRWLAPTGMFFELGAEVLRGDSYPAASAARRGSGSSTVFATFGGDVGVSQSWQLGLSQLHAEARGREDVNGAGPFNGTSRLNIVDLVWKWAPEGNAKVTNLVLQGEYFRRHEQGDYTAGHYDAGQSGYYAQAVYQFMPRWRVGLRYDRLHSENAGAALAGTVLDAQGHSPARRSAMVDFSNSEYSRLRLQYNLDDSGPQRDHQWLAHYVVSLGSHGAHRF